MPHSYNQYSSEKMGIYKWMYDSLVSEKFRYNFVGGDIEATSKIDFVPYEKEIKVEYSEGKSASKNYNMAL